MAELFPMYMASIYSDANLLPALFGFVLLIPALFLIVCNVDFSRDIKPNVQAIVYNTFLRQGRRIVFEVKKGACPTCKARLKTSAKIKQHSIVECQNSHKFLQVFNTAMPIRGEYETEIKTEQREFKHSC